MKVLILLISLLWVPLALSFEIYPYKKYDGSNELIGEKSWRDEVDGIITDPIHEEITLRSLELAKKNIIEDGGDITDEDFKQIIQGVRWNDDPLGYFPSKPDDWVVYFKHAGLVSKHLNSSYDLLYRSHYHDLQYLHAMASSKDETAEKTTHKILSWIEFSYKVAVGTIPPRTPFKEMEPFLSKESYKYFKEAFTSNGTRLDWTPTYLFSKKCDRKIIYLFKTELDCLETNWLTDEVKVKNIALGSVLHVIQDSFSDSHVHRENAPEGKISKIHGVGRILSYHMYRKQSSDEHKKADQYPSDYKSNLEKMSVNLEEVGEFVISSAYRARDGEDNWNMVRKTLKEMVFNPVNLSEEPTFEKYK